MEQYNVTGMSCAACSARVEKAVNNVPGVTSCAVSLLTNSMGVEGTASAEEIIAAVQNAGYGASVKGAEKTNAASSEDALTDKETPVLKRRLLLSIGFLAVLMYFSMGHTMLGAPLPAFFEGNHVAVALVQMILAAIVMIINKKFFTSGLSSLMHRAPNMDTLVALGSMASFVWSTAVLFSMTRAVADGRYADAESGMMNLYFESAAMILTLITVGKMLEARSKGKTTDALRGLMKLAPKTACIIRGDEEVTVPVEEVRKGDIFVVRPGENIPVDGIVIEGNSAVNEAALTGESIPADKVSGIFVPVVILIALITIIVWLIVGKEFSYALARVISVLVISCPCADEVTDFTALPENGLCAILDGRELIGGSLEYISEIMKILSQLLLRLKVLRKKIKLR